MKHEMSNAFNKEKFDMLIDLVKSAELQGNKWCRIIKMMDPSCFENKEDVIEFAQAKAYRRFYLNKSHNDDFDYTCHMLLNTAHLTAQLQVSLNHMDHLFDLSFPPSPP
jgi:hypothetical protein